MNIVKEFEAWLQQEEKNQIKELEIRMGKKDYDKEDIEAILETDNKRVIEIVTGVAQGTLDCLTYEKLQNRNIYKNEMFNLERLREFVV